MKKKIIAVTSVISMMLVIIACKKEINQQIGAVFPGFQQPANFPGPSYRFAANNVNQAGFELGRRLFYEPRLSRDNTVSCGSCHIQSSAFTHHGHDISHGIDDRLGKRNSPPIMNLAWSTSFMWDGGIFDLDLQPIAPITAHEEMDESMEHVLQKLKEHPDYPALFKEAFGSDEITTQVFLKALSQFMLLCISSNSRYDSVMREQGVIFTEAESSGYKIFQQKCGNCHAEPLFTDHSFRNNGIGIGFNNDSGRYAITLNTNDMYKFKVPSLRNLKYTAPYMHDGRYYTLDAVLDQYSLHMKPMANLDPELQQDGNVGIPLTQQERSDLLAFLNTLNDAEFVTNPMLAE